MIGGSGGGGERAGRRHRRADRLRRVLRRRRQGARAAGASSARRPTCPACRCRTRRPPRRAARTAAPRSWSAPSRRPPTTRRCSPQPFLQALGEVPKPSGAVQIGGGDVQAYRYDNLKPNGFDRTVTVYAAPTSAGVATLACLAPAADAESFAATCDQIANTLELSSGDPLPVGPSKAYAGAVSKALAALGKADKAGQAKLKSAKTPQAAGGRRALAGQGVPRRRQDARARRTSAPPTAAPTRCWSRRCARRAGATTRPPRRRPRRASRHSARPAATSRRAARPSRARSPG